MTSGQWLNQSHLCKEASIKTQKGGLWRTSGLVNTWRFVKSDVLTESLEASCPFPIPCLMHPFHVALPELHSFIIN